VAQESLKYIDLQRKKEKTKQTKNEMCGWEEGHKPHAEFIYGLYRPQCMMKARELCRSSGGL
jgi:hypothetical protein